MWFMLGSAPKPLNSINLTNLFQASIPKAKAQRYRISFYNIYLYCINRDLLLTFTFLRVWNGALIEGDINAYDFDFVRRVIRII